MKTFKYFNLNLFSALLIIFTVSNQMCMAQNGFVSNKGQLLGTDSLKHPEIRYYGNAGNTTLYLRDSVFSYVFAEADTDRTLSDSLHTYFIVDTLYRTDMRLKSISNGYSIIATDTSQGYNNYFYGDSSWTHALTYQVIKYSGIYSGVDLSFYNNDEFRFNLDSNAANSIKIYYQGTDSVRVIHDTILCVYTPLGSKTYMIKAYEYYRSIWVPFQADFHKADSIIGFTLGTHHTGIPVMIKVIAAPAVAPPAANSLRWCTYYVHDNPTYTEDQFNDIYIDESENIYTIGSTAGTAFPIWNAIFQPQNNGGLDVVVVKFKPDRSREFATFYGGSKLDKGTGITVDGNDNVIFTGYTRSDTDFPGCLGCGGGVYQQSFGGGNSDAFVVKLTWNGQTKLMSTYYGGSGDEGNSGIGTGNGISIAVDNADNFVIGGACSDEVPQPGTNPGFYHDFNGGGWDGFLAQFDENNVQIWATHLGGSSYDAVISVCTDADQNIYAYGTTQSTATSALQGPITSYNGTAFPICEFAPAAPGQYVEGHSGNLDMSVSKFRGSNHELMWSTQFGGALGEFYGDIAVSPYNNDIFITGSTSSNESTDLFPIEPLTGAYNDGTFSGGGDAFIAKFDDVYHIQWCTYYGGNSNDYSQSIAINNNGDVYIAGETTTTNLTMLQSGCQLFYDNAYSGTISYDGFILRFAADGSSIYRTYMGGTNTDYINAIACQKNDPGNGLNIVVTGYTSSTSAQNFPLHDFVVGPTTDYFQPNLAAIYHPFITNLLDDNSACRMAGNGHEKTNTLITVFPNPSNGTIFFSSKGNEMGDILITDIMGKIVFSNPDIAADLFTCDLNKFSNGIYFSQIFVSGIIYRNKIIISR